MTAPALTEVSWDFPPLTLALRCVNLTRSTIDMGTMAHVAQLFKDYGLGPLPQEAQLRSPDAWEAWLPLCAAAYCQAVVQERQHLPGAARLQDALQAFANAGQVEIALLGDQDTPASRRLVACFLGQLQQTARDQMLRLQPTTTRRPLR